MADQKKISALPLASEVRDNDVFVGNQDGITKRMAAASVLQYATAKIGFSQSTDFEPKTMGKKAQQTISVTDDPFNAVSGEVSSTAAFQAAYDFAPAGGRIIVPGPGPYTVGALTGTKFVTWEVQYDINTNVGLLGLPGTVEGNLGVADTTYRANGLGSDFALRRFSRTANYDGGTPGNVCSNLRAYTNVSNNQAKSFEWVINATLDNSGQGQNVAVYGQGNRRAGSAFTLGGTFAGCFEARDFTQEVNPTTGLIGVEIDCFANGTDSNNRRVALDVISGKGVADGARSEAAYGVRVGPSHNDSASSRFKNAFYAFGEKDYGLRILGVTIENSVEIASTGAKIGVNVGGANSDADFVSSGTSQYGMRLSGTYASGVALRLNSGSAIALEATGAIKLNYTGGKIQLMNAALVKTSWDTSTGAMFIGANQVVGPRITGWNAPAGTQTRGTFDVATATVATCAAAIAAIIADNRTHGLIGA